MRRRRTHGEEDAREREDHPDQVGGALGSGHAYRFARQSLAGSSDSRPRPLSAVPRIKAPLLVVHGSDDSLVPSRFGRLLYERATSVKRFLLVEGGTHTTTSWRGAEQYRAALREFFGVG